MSFKARIGKNPKIYPSPQLGVVDDDTLRALYDVIYYHWDTIFDGKTTDRLIDISRQFWSNVLEEPREIFEDRYEVEFHRSRYAGTSQSFDSAIYGREVLSEIWLEVKEKFLSEKFYDLYETIEILGSSLEGVLQENYVQSVNQVLETYWCGYRVSFNGEVIPVSSEKEKYIVDGVLTFLSASTELTPVFTLYRSALMHLAPGNIDTRASSHASVSALEAFILSMDYQKRKTPTDLSGGLKALKQQNLVSASFEKYCSQFWDYANRRGIRHGQDYSIVQSEILLMEARRNLLLVGGLIICYITQHKLNKLP